MTTSGKTGFDKVQSALAVVTPLLVLGIGAFLNQNITRVESQIKNVEAMKPYFDMMAGDDPAKAKMAAYALYMLNREDPSMAVSMIMAAPPESDLMAVLIDLGSREPAIWQEVRKIVQTADDTVDQTEMQKAAQKIIGGIGTTATTAAAGGVKGWSYLGNFTPPIENARIELKAGEELPTVGKTYELLLTTNLRADKPEAPDYTLATVTGVATSGSSITIIGLDVDSKKRVWAEIMVKLR